MLNIRNVPLNLQDAQNALKPKGTRKPRTRRTILRTKRTLMCIGLLTSMRARYRKQKQSGSLASCGPRLHSCWASLFLAISNGDGTRLLQPWRSERCPGTVARYGFWRSAWAFDCCNEDGLTMSGVLMPAANSQVTQLRAMGESAAQRRLYGAVGFE